MYWGHSGVGLYFKVFAGMVRIECISLCYSRIFWVWWLHMIMVVVEGSSLVAILVQWIASMVDFWSSGWAILTPIHLEDFASPNELKIMSQFYGKLYCLSCVEHVRNEE